MSIESLSSFPNILDIVTTSLGPNDNHKYILPIMEKCSSIPEKLTFVFGIKIIYRVQYGIKKKSKEIENIQNDYSTYIVHFELSKNNLV